MRNSKFLLAFALLATAIVWSCRKEKDLTPEVPKLALVNSSGGG